MKMPLNRILVDSSYLYALFDEKNKYHLKAAEIANLYHLSFVIPQVVLTEAAYLFNRTGGIPAVLQFLDRLITTRLNLEDVLISDLPRVREIMNLYSDTKLDFVDCCIMALSERMKITQVCTFDRRDFSIFRPSHCDYLELLP
jgi:predicted nucleic acid-binding protein